MRKWILFIIIFLLVVALGCGGLVAYCYRDYQANHDALKLQVDYTDVQTDIRQSLSPVRFRVENLGYQTIEYRETVVLSLFDSQGNPVSIGGTAAIPSSWDLYEWDDVSNMDPSLIQPNNYVYPRTEKTVQGHQAVYSKSGYILKATPWYQKLFQNKRCSENWYCSDYALVKKVGQEVSLQQYSLRLDIILEGKDPQGQWVSLESYSQWIAESPEAVPARLREEPARIPELTKTPSYQWKVQGNAAYLVGIGSVTEPDIVIPQKIHLLQTGTATYQENAFSGTEYYTTFQRGAFQNCQSIETITFQDQVATTEDYVRADEDTLYIDGYVTLQGPGLFEDCPNLTAVYNLPRGITNLKAAFKNCTSLTHVSNLPIAAVNMEECFYGCEALTTCEMIPTGVVDMENCFYGCTSLTQAPEIPMDVRHLSGCFYNCTSLTGTVELSAEVLLHLKWSEEDLPIFADCSSLDAVTVDYCSRFPTTLISEAAPVDFSLGEHNRNGLCEVCRYVTRTETIDGITVVMEDVPEERYVFFVDYIDNTLPEFLKKACRKITFVLDAALYYNGDPPDNLAGFARSPYGEIYVEYRENPDGEMAAVSTLYHELAHTYDFNFSTYYRFSQSQQWASLHESEGEWAANQYGPSYDEKSEREKKKETFAVSAAVYFTDPELLKANCPEIYAYLESIFGMYGQ